MGGSFIRGETTSFDPPIVGESRIAAALREITVRAARSDATVLIEGETGTGKEVVARNIHKLSSRAGGPLVILNAMEVPDSLLQSELFGYAKGTFTGAAADRRGLIEEAGGGTFFLDEIGELSPGHQASLLRAIQEREVRRIGESRRRKVDVRFIFATNRSLASLVRKGAFRMDLFYRVNCFRIEVPPLRERKEDIGALCIHFLKQYLPGAMTSARLLPQETIEFLEGYDWPGNIRELRNEIERIVALYGHVAELMPEMFSFSEKPSLQCAFVAHELFGESMCRDDYTNSSGDCSRAETGARSMYSCYSTDPLRAIGEGKLTLKEAVEKLEKSAITSAMKINGGNKSRTASALGITRQGLLKKMRRYKIELGR